jgi:hypothetical protein
MCCFFSSLLLLGPRIAFLVYWLLAPVRVNLSLAVFNFPWLVSLLGLIFAPWTMLMYVANGFRDIQAKKHRSFDE